MNTQKEIKFIDLFAGMGGTRIGFTQACEQLKISSICVFSSEIKKHAIKAYETNFNDDHKVSGDITTIEASTIPDFDFLLAGFPCQPFSNAGNRKGFLDDRGQLFFHVVNILKIKQPQAFLLENVAGLISHDQGRTLDTILEALTSIGYHINWKLLDASIFGVPQKRERIYIVGNKYFRPNLDNFPYIQANLKDHIDYEFDFEQNEFSKILMKHFSIEQLEGKAIKDKRGGENNIHSWDIELKGKVNNRQKNLLNQILTKRRMKKWALSKGIDWMDGMPLTIDEIKTFIDYPELAEDLSYLTTNKYLALEHPKKKVIVDGIAKRIYDENCAKGYNIVAGKLSYPFSYIIDPKVLCPTIVASEVGKIAIATPKGVRAINNKESLAFSGFPADYKLDDLSYKEIYDLIGNTVMPPVIKAVTIRTLQN